MNRTGFMALVVGAVAVAGTVWAETPDEKYRPSLFARFGEHANVPDGLTQDADGNIFLSAPNYLNKAYPAVIMKRCEKTGRWSVLVPALANPATGRGGPMGIEMGPDGNLYYCDNQYFFNPRYQSRVLRVVLDKEGNPLRIEPVVERLMLANAVRFYGNELFVTETHFDLPGMNLGGVYRIPMADFMNGPVKLLDKEQASKDPYLLGCTTTDVIPGRGDNSGADGMCIDKDGNVYVGTFGDAHFYTLKRNADGSYSKPELLFHDTKAWSCCDGICYYAKKNWVIITDSERNAVRYWDIAEKKLGLLWQNPDTDGADGLLDQPCEPMVWKGRKLIITNFDMTFPGLWNKTNDDVHTLSVINLGGGCPFLNLFR
jgi:hypothetical protein